VQVWKHEGVPSTLETKIKSLCGLTEQPKKLSDPQLDWTDLDPNDWLDTQGDFANGTFKKTDNSNSWNRQYR